LKIKQQKIVKEDQFIVAEIDAKLGAFGVIPKELAGAIVSSHYFLFDLDKSRVNPEYFDYVIRYGSYEKLIQPFVKGTTNYASIRPKDILKLRLPLPDPDIQEIIAERIRRQELIMFNTDSARNSIKEALIDQSDFDGNWPLMDLEEVCQEIRNGGTPTRTNPSFFGGGVPWVKSGELEDNIIEKTEETLTKKGLESSNAKILPKGTVLIALYGATIGKTAILEIDASTNQAVSGLVPKTSKIVSEYLRYYLCTLRPYYMQKARGSAQRNINTEIMKSVKVPVPSKSVQIEIVRKIDDRKTILSDLEATKKRSRSVIGQIVQSIGQADYILDSEKTKRISDFQ
jgi:restriction endonuclease S subunit